MDGEGRIVLTKRTVNKNGDIAYSRDGVRSTVYANKGMFAGDAPETITLESDGASFRTVNPGVDPAVVAERAEKAQIRAAKAAERAQKAQELAAKAQENAAKASEAAASM